MPISPSPSLALIEPGDSMDISQVHAELAWIESRALDAGNTSGGTMQGPLTVPSLVIGGSTVNPKSFFYYGSDNSATVNILTVTASFPNAMSAGLLIAVKVANTNTAAATLNVNSLGAYSILQGGNLLSGGELTANGGCLLEFDGTYWNVVGMAPGGNPNATLEADILNATTVNATTVNATTWTGAWASMPATTESVFYQAAAPPGWTQNVSINDQVLRVVSGVGGGAGGNWDNSNGLSVASHSHGMGNHTHEVSADAQAQVGSSFYFWYWNSQTKTSSGPSTNTSDLTQPGVSSNSSWRPAYINVIACSKN